MTPEQNPNEGEGSLRGTGSTQLGAIIATSTRPASPTRPRSPSLPPASLERITPRLVRPPKPTSTSIESSTAIAIEIRTPSLARLPPLVRPSSPSPRGPSNVTRDRARSRKHRAPRPPSKSKAKLSISDRRGWWNRLSVQQRRL